MKLSVQPKRKTDNEYWNEAYDDFRSSPQQPCQPAYHGLEENSFNEDKNTSINNYQSDPKPSKRHKSLEEKRIDLKILKEKKQNLELQHAMKRPYSFSGLEELSIPTRLQSIKRPKKTRSIIAQTMRTSVLFAIISKAVLMARSQTKGTQKLSGCSLLKKLIHETTPRWKKMPLKTRLASKIFWIEFL